MLAAFDFLGRFQTGSEHLQIAAVSARDRRQQLRC